MVESNMKKTLSSAAPYLRKILDDTIRGYALGCAIGVLTPSRKSTLESMHQNGKNFAMMSATYSATEMSMQAIRKKNDYINSVVAGAAAGAIGSKKGIAQGSVVFGIYSGISTYLQNLNDKASEK